MPETRRSRILKFSAVDFYVVEQWFIYFLDYSICRAPATKFREAGPYSGTKIGH